jgi:cytidylate kinase
MIIAIDGPAGAGKSTTARAVARHLGYAYVDTGAMYRAVAVAAVEAGLRLPRDQSQLVELASALPIHLRDDGTTVLVDERDVTHLLSSPEISEMASQVAAVAGVRAAIVAQQRRLAREAESATGGAVLEGRDIQTVVFPEAEVKVFLTASAATRAERRRLEWSASGNEVAAEGVLAELVRRDDRDSRREASPLRAADDAVVVETDDATTDQIVERIAALARLAARTPATPQP